ncbi:MAG: formyltetrahydrofolate deformylase [Sandarakinorhabdus sp.]|nr:formyltetrahydrofolate deformylase [Sandarakinorhabdus sp.]
MIASLHNANIVLRIIAPDRPGILAAIAPALFAGGWDIREAAVYGDPDTQQFFVRMHIAGDRQMVERLPLLMAPHEAALDLSWDSRDLGTPLRTLVAVSKHDHCLVDIIHKVKIGSLPIEIVGIVSNHETCRPLAEWHGYPFHHLPVTPATREQQEAAFADRITQSGADLVVLARYMQILSNALAERLAGRCINIHHSFLPSFRGARPYHQAQARGVKIIGATAHYVTADLDEGPIIEQDVRRVTHSATAEDCAAIGRETEASVLSRAIRWHAEYRVFPNGARTVVFG